MLKYLIIPILLVLLIPKINILNNTDNPIIKINKKLIGDFPVPIKTKKIQITTTIV